MNSVKLEVVFRLDGNFRLVEFRAVEAEHIDEEIIDSLTLRGAEVVTLVGQMDVANLTSSTIERVDAPHERHFYLRRGGSPVATVAHQEQGPWGNETGELRLTGTTACQMDRHAALTRTAAVEMAGHMDHGG